MTIDERKRLIAALQIIGMQYIENHPKPADGSFLCAAHWFVGRHHNHARALQLSTLDNNMEAIALLKFIDGLYDRFEKSFHLAPKIHACLCEHNAAIAKQSRQIEQRLDHQFPAGGEYTNPGLQIKDYKEAIAAGINAEQKPEFYVCEENTTRSNLFEL